jgi:hypothetical protein
VELGENTMDFYVFGDISLRIWTLFEEGQNFPALGKFRLNFVY